jgi:hypothetical protein
VRTSPNPDWRKNGLMRMADSIPWRVAGPTMCWQTVPPSTTSASSNGLHSVDRTRGHTPRPSHTDWILGSRGGRRGASCGPHVERSRRTAWFFSKALHAPRGSVGASSGTRPAHGSGLPAPSSLTRLSGLNSSESLRALGRGRPGSVGIPYGMSRLGARVCNSTHRHGCGTCYYSQRRRLNDCSPRSPAGSGCRSRGSRCRPCWLASGCRHYR